MSLEDDIACLNAVPTFGLLGPQALRILAIGCESRTVPEGEVLFKAGQPADCGYVVQEGAFRLQPPRTGDSPQAEISEAAEVATVGAGVLLGELALIVETVRPVTAIAAERSIVMRIPRQLFRKTLEGFPEAAQRLRDNIAARARETAAEISQVRSALDTDAPDE